MSEQMDKQANRTPHAGTLAAASLLSLSLGTTRFLPAAGRLAPVRAGLGALEFCKARGEGAENHSFSSAYFIQ